MPLPDSEHAWGDVLLNDGEAKGYRMDAGQEVPVFNELQILIPSASKTFAVSVVAPTSEDSDALLRSDETDSMGIEDWTTVEILCASCSEGRPHAHEKPSDAPWQAERRVGIGAEDEQRVRALLDRWTSEGAGRSVQDLRCEFSHAGARSGG